MLEIKISIETALGILLNRMELELRIRQKDKIIPRDYSIEDLSVEEIEMILEAAIIDTIFILPVEMVINESNLEKIIIETIKLLAKKLNREEFFLFPEKKVKHILGFIRNTINNPIQKKIFDQN